MNGWLFAYLLPLPLSHKYWTFLFKGHPFFDPFACKYESSLYSHENRLIWIKQRPMLRSSKWEEIALLKDGCVTYLIPAGNIFCRIWINILWKGAHIESYEWHIISCHPHQKSKVFSYKDDDDSFSSFHSLHISIKMFLLSNLTHHWSVFLSTFSFYSFIFYFIQ